jgi:hypothetical protein
MKEEETEKVGRFFLYLITAVVVLLILTGCTTTGKTTTNEDSLNSLICLGFCVETDIKTKTEIRKE